jgi:hypothetical protein
MAVLETMTLLVILPMEGAKATADARKMAQTIARNLDISDGVG